MCLRVVFTEVVRGRSRSYVRNPLTQERERTKEKGRVDGEVVDEIQNTYSLPFYLFSLSSYSFLLTSFPFFLPLQNGMNLILRKIIDRYGRVDRS